MQAHNRFIKKKKHSQTIQKLRYVEKSNMLIKKTERLVLVVQFDIETKGQ